MRKNEIAKELAELGASDFRLTAKIKAHLAALEENRARRCAILTELAQHPDTGLDADIVAASVQPKSS